MKAEGLTAKQVQYIKPNPERRLEVPAGPPGLYLVIHPTGKKTWAARYRWHGRPSKLTLGTYPEVTLAGARAEFEAARSNLERGINPIEAKVEEEERKPNGVGPVADEWLERYVRPRTRARTRCEFERIMNRDVVPAWSRKLISEVGRADVLRVLDAIVDRGAPISANRTYEVLRSWFNWCVERGIVNASPVAGIRPPSAEKSRDRVLEPGELYKVWRASEVLGFPFGPFFQLLIFTAQRRSEIANLQWDHVNFRAAIFTLPAESTKSDRTHDVPLSPPALELLESLPRFTGGPFIFTSTSGKRPVSGFSKAKKALEAAMLNGMNAGTHKIGDWTLHDLRRTAATHMAKVGVPPHVLSAILNHAPGTSQGVTSIYNRFRYTEERREALSRWAEYVLKLAEAQRELAVG